MKEDFDQLLSLRADSVSPAPRVIRKISGLSFAEICSPIFPEAKPSPARASPGFARAAALGLRYERACFKRVKRWFREAEVLHNPWIRFRDENGKGFACPDIVALREAPVVFECKLSWNPIAVEQLELLYLPLLRSVFRSDFACVVLCKQFRGAEAPPIEVVSHPNDARPGRVSLMIWSS